MITYFDVLVANFSAGVIGRLGFSWEEVKNSTRK
ncbi:MAG: hypothetical protein COA75_03940 [Cellvibrionales bacterium]|nr:MAG: hypothetical protein COA75_03940 [Cellvibrionales bacterium]